MLLIDSKVYESQELPAIHFGLHRALSYALNPKAACTLALHFLFYVNHNYRYYDLAQIHFSHTALLRLRGTELDPRVLDAYYRLSPESFTIVRDPLRRFVSGFSDKILIGGDPGYNQFRDLLTSLHNVDLSPEADRAQSCLSFAKWIAAQKDQGAIDPHFRPQHINLRIGSRFTLDTILRLEDRDALLAFFTKWIGEEKAKWFLTLKFNVQKYAIDEFITDELKDVVRRIYAKDYEYFYT